MRPLDVKVAARLVGLADEGQLTPFHPLLYLRLSLILEETRLLTLGPVAGPA